MDLAELSKNLKIQDYIVLHPYSMWKTKLWPWEYHQKVIDAFPDKTFVFVGNGEMFPYRGGNVIDYRGKTTMDELCRILSNAQLVLTTDSGPAHIASLFNIPTLCLFGATDWEKTGPKGEKTEVVHQNLDCQPCLKRECFRPKKMECLTTITPQVIIEAIKSRI
jgi:ADP-heptose:LPS heptosyltransferase